jgi:hypothetical protein
VVSPGGSLLPADMARLSKAGWTTKSTDAFRRKCPRSPSVAECTSE